MKMGKNVGLPGKTRGFVLLVVTAAVLIAVLACKTPTTPTPTTTTTTSSPTTSTTTSSPTTTTTTSSPTTSTTTTTIPTIVKVTVTSPDSTIPVTKNEQMTATVTMSDGKTKPGTGTWGSDTPGVATINQSGLVTAMAPGDTTIFFRTNGLYVSGATGSGQGTKNVGVTGSVRGIINVGARGSVHGTKNVGATDYVEGVKRLTVRNIWSNKGVGDTVFDMPTYVTRVKITGTYTGYSSNFIVHIGGQHVVNELLGTGWGPTYFEGTYLTSGGTVEITNSSGVSWTFTEVVY